MITDVLWVIDSQHHCMSTFHARIRNRAKGNPMSVAEELIDAGYDADAINRMPLLKNAYTIDSIREALTSCGIEDDDIENVIEYLTD